MPVEFRSKIFALKKNVDGMTYQLFLQALANLVTKFTKLATTGNVTDFSAGHGAKQAFMLPRPQVRRQILMVAAFQRQIPHRL